MHDGDVNGGDGDGDGGGGVVSSFVVNRNRFPLMYRYTISSLSR